jgi:hypothetical protein
MEQVSSALDNLLKYWITLKYKSNGMGFLCRATGSIIQVMLDGETANT